MATLVYEHVSELATSFGERGVTSEAVAAQVAKEVQAYQAGTGALGPHLADQWMLPLALAACDSKTTASFTCSDMTEHSTTNIGVIQAFLPVRIDVVRTEPQRWSVTVDARGLEFDEELIHGSAEM